MPTICKFRGIKIYINYRDHLPSHFHAEYGEYDCCVSIEDIEIPRGVEEYFKNGPVKITKVIPNDDYSLTVYFDNNEHKVYHMAENLFGVFEVLQDKEKFKAVFIDEYGNVAWDIDHNIDSSIDWNNRIDICKDAVYMDSITKQ